MEAIINSLFAIICIAVILLIVLIVIFLRMNDRVVENDHYDNKAAEMQTNDDPHAETNAVDNAFGTISRNDKSFSDGTFGSIIIHSSETEVES